MKTVSMLVVGMLLGVAANAAQTAGDESVVATITVTAKRPHSSAAAETAPPRAAVEIAAPLPTDMPEMEIDSHMTLIDVAAVPAVARVAL